MPDSERPGPRRFVPVPGLLDIDAVEDANFAEAFGEEDDLPDEAPDPLDPPPPPPLTEPDDEPPEAPPVLERPPVAPPTSGEADEPEAPSPVEAPALDEPEASVPDPPAAPGEPPVAETDDKPLGPTPPQEPGDQAAEGSPAAPSLTPPRAVVDSAKAATRSRGREFVQLLLRYGRAHLPRTEPRPPTPDTGPPRMVGRIGQVIPFLQLVPWLLGIVFAVSFLWDFPGVGVEVFGEVLPLDGLLRVLSVSGLIGFLTNWLAITMLFQPREKRAVIPQGLIPAQRERVIYRLSDAISRELINADIIKQKIQESGVIGRYRDLALGVVRGVVEDPGFRADLKTLATDYAQEVLGSEAVRREVAQLAVQKVEEQAGQGLGGLALRLYRTFAEDDFQRRVDRALDELPSAVVPLLDRIDTALDAVPAKVEARADEVEEAATKAVLSFVEGFDIRAMIQEKARGFDEGQLESLLKSTSNEQLNYIKYLGAVLGVFGGLVIWQPVGALVAFTAVGLGLWGIDEALVRARRRAA